MCACAAAAARALGYPPHSKALLRSVSDWQRGPTSAAQLILSHEHGRTFLLIATFLT
jgi:hypothetical protein